MMKLFVVLVSVLSIAGCSNNEDSVSAAQRVMQAEHALEEAKFDKDFDSFGETKAIEKSRAHENKILELEAELKAAKEHQKQVDGY